MYLSSYPLFFLSSIVVCLNSFSLFFVFLFLVRLGWRGGFGGGGVVGWAGWWDGRQCWFLFWFGMGWGLVWSGFGSGRAGCCCCWRGWIGLVLVWSGLVLSCPDFVVVGLASGCGVVEGCWRLSWLFWLVLWGFTLVGAAVAVVGYLSSS